MEDHEPIVVNAFNGLYASGTREACPQDYCCEFYNMKFLKDGVETRDGSLPDFSFGSILRAFEYKRSGEATRYIILDNAGQLWDSTNLVIPILSIPGMIDFSILNFNDRAYITPHNRVTGKPGNYLYVYNGTGIARLASGTSPVGTTITAVDGSSGFVEEGIHIIAVAYETDSGFITRPGPAIYTVYTAPGLKKINLSNIPVGPEYIVRKHILATKSISGYNGDQNGYELFFVPNGSIGNLDTVWTIDFFDTDLNKSADYLLEQKENIDAGLGLCKYGNRMVVWGFNSDPDIVRISKDGYPESFSELDGFLVVDKFERESCVTNGTTLRDFLYLTKSGRTYGTSDIGDPVTAWKVIDIDRGIGAEVFGIATIIDSKSNNVESFFVVDKRGLYINNGTYVQPELTHNIKDIWDRVNKDAFNTIQVVNNPTDKEIYISVPLDSATEPSHVLYGDYFDGLDADNIGWSLWKFYKRPTSIFTSIVGNSPVFKYASSEGSIYKLDDPTRNDDGNAYQSYIQTAYFKLSNGNPGMFHYAGHRACINGYGILIGTLYGLHDKKIKPLPNKDLASLPGKDTMFRANFVNERISLKIQTGNVINEWFRITSFTAFLKFLWQGRSSV